MTRGKRLDGLRRKCNGPTTCGFAKQRIAWLSAGMDPKTLESLPGGTRKFRKSDLAPHWRAEPEDGGQSASASSWPAPPSTVHVAVGGIEGSSTTSIVRSATTMRPAPEPARTGVSPFSSAGVQFPWPCPVQATRLPPDGEVAGETHRPGGLPERCGDWDHG